MIQILKYRDMLMPLLSFLQRNHVRDMIGQLSSEHNTRGRAVSEGCYSLLREYYSRRAKLQYRSSP